MVNLPELFGSMVFNDAVMKDRLPHETYKALKKTIQEGKPLEPSIASVVANAMKDWATEKGVTHYTHWFQPMTGITAEKHDSFISPQPDGGVIMEFSGKELSKGESDASSFPSGGLRATFEARGYTAWDPTSYAFIKDGTLCIPTAFCSYTGEALDKKTPLLRSMNVLNTQALRVLKLFGTPAKRITTTVGAEQEYFLIDRETYNKRRDLIYTGRTLFGAKPPKGQELDDHYYGFIKIRIAAYMKELNEELWKLGILAKTEHNEAAPAQHELAPIYTSTNVACDHNQLTMEIMRKVAKRHNMTCLLHEKPFAWVNGSGKHNNWSLTTDKGVNLLDPGTTPEENAQFLTFLVAVIKAVDEYQDLLRISVATAGNDHRLGSNEAPPTIISMFIGDELDAILSAIDTGEHYNKKEVGNIEVGVDVLPSFPKDVTDRNRTSSFAFTGNKFEFRMPGATLSVAEPNTVLNTIVAEALCQFADELEAADDFGTALNELIRKSIKEHKRIIFNGNGYDESWIIEAEKRGLSYYRSAPEAIPHLLDQKNIDLYTKYNIYTKNELYSRCEIYLENYCKAINVEALTMLDMARVDILPAVIKYTKDISDAICAKKCVSSDIPARADTAVLTRVSTLADTLYDRTEDLDATLSAAGDIENLEARSIHYRNCVLTAMSQLREAADELESIVSAKHWPYPSYGTILYRV